MTKCCEPAVIYNKRTKIGFNIKEFTGNCVQ